MEENANRAEAIRLLGVAEKLLQNRDFNGSRDFAILAQETEPLLDGSDQIIAIADVLLAADKRINNHHDWYSILQIDRRCEDNDLIKKQLFEYPRVYEAAAAPRKVVETRNNVTEVRDGNVSGFAPRKRGRPRKNPL
ncbi:putative dnajc14 protein [Corchorus capsularis]|uniref:Putative dnajc14 protein n=1 Tax=Corchorus capsularis TaxID=210143 RepID=A0A1R3FY11_COCAP|nr:putative dnajc14 protein [Corchorus capsularis]